MKNIIPQKSEIATDNRNTLSENSAWVPAKGELVKALGAGGSSRILKVWEVGDRVIYLCSEGQYAELQLGAKNKPAIGFPKRDVFKVSEAVSK